MAVDKKISQLTSLAQVDVDAALDVLPIVDTSAVETKKITVSALVGAGASAGLTSVDINSGTIDGTSIGASSASTGAFTTLTTSSTVTLNGGTANGVLYLNGSKVATSGSALTFDGTRLAVGGAAQSIGNAEVVGNGIAAGLTVVSATSNGYNGRFYVDTTAGTVNVWTGKLGAGSGYPIAFSIDGTEGMRLTSTGLGLGTTSPGSRLDVKGTLRLSGSTSGYVGLSPAAAAGSTTYTLPSADGTTGQFLSTNGTGTLSWASASAGGGAQDYIVQRFGIV